jgi:4,5-DOPA dioxygenase extradiol
VLILGSGNIVHNLARLDWGSADGAFDWAQRFDGDVAEIMTRRPEDLPSLQTHDDFAMAAPTPDHFIPLLYLAGLAAAAGDTAHVLVDGYAMGSLSMASYTLGYHEVVTRDSGGSPPLPHIPGDETNI